LPASEKPGTIYFIFNTLFLEKVKLAENQHLISEMNWEKVYSQYYSPRKGDIVVGYIR